jgi:hypothetical protein
MKLSKFDEVRLDIDLTETDMKGLSDGLGLFSEISQEGRRYLITIKRESEQSVEFEQLQSDLEPACIEPACVEPCPIPDASNVEEVLEAVHEQ